MITEGVHYDMTDEEYHKQYGSEEHFYSSSQLKTMLDDPEKFHKEYNLGIKKPTAQALQDAFATKIEPLLRSMIEEMGIESFIDTYGKEIYEAFNQSIMNKSFQDFTKKGPRLSPTETRRAMEDGRIPNKKDISEASAANPATSKLPSNAWMTIIPPYAKLIKDTIIPIQEIRRMGKIENPNNESMKNLSRFE